MAINKEYKCIVDEENECELCASVEAAQNVRFQRVSVWTTRVCYALVSITFVTSLLANMISFHGTLRGKSTAFGITEFGSIYKEVEELLVRFTGTPKFLKDGSASMEHDSKEPYVGLPSQEIDNSWTELYRDNFIYITEQEAEESWGDARFEYYKHPDFGYLVTLDVMHTIHCLNVLRRAIYSSHYGEAASKGPSLTFQMYHIDHCLEAVRQSVQCHADLTLIPTRWREGIEQPFVDTNQTHTCRNYDKIRAWTDERYNGSLAVHDASAAKVWTHHKHPGSN